MNMSNIKPVRKVAAGGISGAAVTMIIFGFHQAGITIPAEVAAASVTILSFVSSWFTKDK